MEPDQSNRPQGTIAKITNFFGGANSSATKTLIKWKQSPEQEEWANKAVDTLVKKLKKKKDGIKDIQEVLKARTPASKCVTIPRSVDGRLQVSNHKSLPHVIYCRVWRWPDLHNHHELKAVKTCEFPFNAKKSDVCINPYHYDRVPNQSVLPPILVPRQSDFATGQNSIHNSQPYSMVATQETKPDIQQMYYTNSNSNYANNGFGPINGFNSQCSSGQNSPMSSISSSSAGYQQPTYPYPMANSTQSSPNWPDNATYMQQQSDMEQVHYVEPDHWANVAYYELNSRVGELFRCHNNSYELIVDGFTHPSCNTSNRFCLGQLSNVNRNSTIEQTRRHIGKGVHIFQESNELYIRCLSEAPIFVHSLMANHLNNLGTNLVYKIERDQHMKIFDNNEFANMLTKVVNSGFEASYALTRMCTVRVSFVKGWNGQYHRQEVTSCPCWFEIHLNGPLKWLDNVLNKMGSPLYAISSVS